MSQWSCLMFSQTIVCIFMVICLTSGADVGSPVYLTPLLEEGKYSEAQRVSRVTPDIGNITSYSGFFTVNQTCDSHLFFWFMPAQNGDWQKAPLLYWQQGGPGTSSFFGMFEEIGPFQYFNKTGLTKRKLSWNMENNLLIIDNPGGVGFSYTGKGCYPDNEADVGKLWYEALVQFYKLFPQLRNNSFILSGESYAGHYIPSYAYTIHKNNKNKPEVKVNLTGIMILGSWSDPISQVDYGDYYYHLGLIDDQQRDVYYNYQKQCKESIKLEQWDNVIYYCNFMTGTLFNTFIGPVNIYNLLQGPSKEEQNWEEFIQSEQIRKAFHVGNLSYQTYNDDVLHTLARDQFSSVKPYIEELLERYHMVFVNGQLDLVCPYPLMVNFLRNLTWSRSSTYLIASRKMWCYNGEIVGYFKGKYHLYDIMVRGSGHYIPQDKPTLAYLLVNSVTSGLPNHPLHALQRCDFYS